MHRQILDFLVDPVSKSPLRLAEGSLENSEIIKGTLHSTCGLEAVFDEELKGSERVAILLEILGRQTRLVISSDVIGRA